MRLVVKKDDVIVNELQFANGPIHLGRDTGCEVFLSDRMVSRKHAVISFDPKQEKWVIEDQGSTNKTCLNGKAVEKSEIAAGDIVRIAMFTIEINLADDTIADEPINLDDTLTKTAYDMETAGVESGDSHVEPVRSPRDPETIIRRVDIEQGSDIRLPAKRARDFVLATEAICRANVLDEVLGALLNIVVSQFAPLNVWCALRNTPSGAMMCHGGRHRGGGGVEFGDIQLKEKITEAIEKNWFLLFPRVPHQRGQDEDDKLNSAMIGPIVGQSGCFGVLYIDNAMDNEHYTPGDLDYLMLLAVHTAVVVENF